MAIRGINEKFLKDLKEGEMKGILSSVKEDKDLSLEIRKDYINIYYRGGNLLKIEQKLRGYKFSFDTKYCSDEAVRNTIRSWTSAGEFEENLPVLKAQIDSWMAKDTAERRFQHDVLIGCPSVADIEYQVPGQNGSYRIDMILSEKGHIVLAENKCGLNAISSRSRKPGVIKPGLRKHYRDFVNLAEDPAKRADLIASVNNILDAKQQLGLIPKAARFDERTVIDFLFVLYDYNPKSRTFRNEADDIIAEFGDRVKRYDTRALFIAKGDDIQISFADAEPMFGSR